MSRVQIPSLAPIFSSRRERRPRMGGVILVLLLVVGVPLAFVIWAINKLNRTADTVDHLESRIFNLELILRDLRARREAPVPPAPVAEASKPSPTPAVEPPKRPPIV